MALYKRVSINVSDFWASFPRTGLDVAIKNLQYLIGDTAAAPVVSAAVSELLPKIALNPAATVMVVDSNLVAALRGRLALVWFFGAGIGVWEAPGCGWRRNKGDKGDDR